MDHPNDFVNSTDSHPILMIPKNCCIPALGFEPNSVKLVNLTISSADTDGMRSDYYSGLCIVKVLDKSYEGDIQKLRSEITETKDFARHVQTSKDEQCTSNSLFGDSAIWSCDEQSSGIISDANKSLEDSALTEASECTVMVQQYETFITDNICDYEEVIGYSTPDEPDTKAQNQAYEQQILHNNGIDLNNLDFYEENELQCAELLCDLPEEIVVDEGSSTKKEDQYMKQIREENHNNFYNHSQNREENHSSALKQLLSSETSAHAENTIMFLSDESQPGQTIHRIELQDPSLKCKGQNNSAEIYYGEPELEPENDSEYPNKKKYLCGSCNQIFNDMASFRQHFDRNERYGSNLKFFCTVCGKTLKSQKKIEAHAKGHGNPDLECSVCRNVYSSKFVLRTHYKKNHMNENDSKYRVDYFNYPENVSQNQDEEHFLILMCEKCDYVANTQTNLVAHSKIHDSVDGNNGIECDKSVDSEELSEDSNDCYLADIKREKNRKASNDTIEKANTVIAKVLSSKMFLCNRQCKGLKLCIVCSKSFDRLSELKRHLIEHIIKSSLAKTPISSESTLNICCAVCHDACFNSISKYKDHLRKHAKLTIYQCTVCDKSFSDSSNFCKHKKVHEANYLQCDLCQRKFNSKKMIAKHMEHHMKTKPKPCVYCDKLFHFESTLNKHVKSVHTKELIRFRCRFCDADFKSLKEKWDHEWSKHQVRKIVVDCLICGLKFRKFTELKRHSCEVHGLTDLSKPKTILMKNQIKKQRR